MTNMNPKKQELVSIGIPTYNRPEQLKKALDSLITQDYENLDIIISDNCSQSSEVDSVINFFSKKDKRIRYFKQDENKGADFNFHFVRSQALSDYFMYLADDHVLLDNQMISKLLRKLRENKDLILAFPNTDLVSSTGVIQSKNHLSKIYSTCSDKYDYLRSWSKYGGGYPFYGVYNLERMRAVGLSFNFESDLRYFNEGIFLYRIFLQGGAIFVQDTTYSFLMREHDIKLSSTSLFVEVLNYYFKTKDFLIYSFRSIRVVYGSSDLSKAQKRELFRIIIASNSIAFFRQVIFPLKYLISTYIFTKYRTKNARNREKGKNWAKKD